MDFDSRKVYGDTSITDGLVFVCMCVNVFTRDLPLVLAQPAYAHELPLVKENSDF